MAENLQRHLVGVSKDKYGANHADHLLEQYKLYVEMADKISERRQSANSFFLAINTALVTALGIVWGEGFLKLSWYSIVGAAGMVLCYSWWSLLKSYRDLNAGKFTVVHAIEQHLPIRPYDAEWAIVGRGKDPERYKPLTHIEILVPWVFFFLYVTLVLVAAFAPPPVKG